MSLETLAARGEAIGVEAADRTRDRLIASANLPSDVDIAASSQGIVLSGKRLRRRYITDPDLRNFAR